MAARFADLARLLEAVASPTRLEILHQLRSPHPLGEIRVTPSLTRAGERPERPLTRQAVTHHVEQLRELGLLQKVPAADGRGEAYVLDHAAVFALVDEVRSLAKLRPLLPDPFAAGETIARPGAGFRLPPPPRLVVAYGREDGAAFSLGDGERWRIGRGAACEIVLDYDPYVSTEHAVVERGASGWTVRDAGSRNGTWLNWEPLRPDRPAPLPAGALLTVGRSVLAFQAP